MKVNLRQTGQLVPCLSVIVLIASFSRLLLAAPPEPDAPRPRHAPGPLGQEVNTFIGTGGEVYLCGNNFPGAMVPFGMVRLSPDTDTISGRLGNGVGNSAGYYYLDRTILGFSHTRLVGTGAVDGGALLVVPMTREVMSTPLPRMSRQFSHERERAFPGYYGVRFPEGNLTAELTATRHVGVHRYTFREEDPARIALIANRALGRGKTRNAVIHVRPEAKEFEGSVELFGTFSNRYGGLKVYFVGRLDQPFELEPGGSDPKSRSGEGAKESQLPAEVVLRLTKSPRPVSVVVQVALSYVSCANARANLDQEVGAATFEQVLQAAITEWEQSLSRIRVDGGTQEQRMMFYTALMRCFQMPTTFMDCNREYLGFDRQTHQATDFTYYTDLSLWDTFRTVHPLYNLIARREQNDMVRSLLAMAEQGGYLPRWPSGGGYTNSMLGTPADIVISEAWLKGIRGFDPQVALKFMQKTAQSAVPHGSRFSGREGIEQYLKYGYCPDDLMKESVARTIEYSWADQAIASFAESLGRTEESRQFAAQGQNYLRLWNPDTKFFQPRHANGEFTKAFLPELLTYLDFTKKYTQAYVEGSAWQWRWGVPSDADALVRLFGRPEEFVKQMEWFFEKSPPQVSVNPNAYYWHGNQPDLFAAFLFNHAGRPDLTQKWVRWILNHKYGVGPNGLDGNDDGGTLSAWYVVSSLGIYPVAGTDRYELCAPLWERSQIQIGQHTLEILAKQTGSRDGRIRQVLLNSKPLNRFWLRHDEIANGGTLVFEMEP